MEKIIFHIDVNSAFLSWEAAYRIKFLGADVDIRDIPSAVGGDTKLRHGIILAKSIPAKRYGIQTGETILEARRKCQSLFLTPPNYNLYETCSKAFINILKEYTSCVEQYSIDEAFMDMSGTKALLGDPVKVAEELKNRIKNELGFTVNVGISNNKVLAKMASDLKKPDLVHTLYPEEISTKMWSLPVSDLFFVGKATTKKLFSLGIKTIGELANSDLNILKLHLKKQGEIIWAFANGIDISKVQSQPVKNKGYGNSTTIAFDVTEEKTASHVILALAETLGSRLRKDEVKIEVVAVGIKYSDLTYFSHQRVLGSATNITNEIYGAAFELFMELWNGQPVRHLGIHTGRVKDMDCIRQINMFDNTDYLKLERVDKTIDMLREQYGNDCIKRAAFVNSPIDHMSGGISREKRTVDYSLNSW